MTQLSTEREFSAGYCWQRAWVKNFGEDGADYESRSREDRPRKYLTQGTEDLVPIRLCYQYDARQKYEEARDRNDPLLSPHGFFRNLKPHERKHALEFTSAFGPLTWTPRDFIRGSDLYTRISLSDFWAKHRRFCRIAALIENYSQPSLLRRALSELHSDLDLLDAADSFPLAKPKSAFRGASRGSVDFARAEFSAWIGSVSDQAVQSAAVSLIQRELVGQLHKRKPWWMKKEFELRFQMTLLSGSLWTILWEMLAWDTNGEVFWRICPHCGKLFYPPRKDRFYCTSEQQVLASKRQYAARMRGKLPTSALISRKKEP